MKALAIILLIIGLLLIGSAIATTIWGVNHPAEFAMGSARSSRPGGYYVVVGLILAGAAAIYGWAKLSKQWIGDE